MISCVCCNSAPIHWFKNKQMPNIFKIQGVKSLKAEVGPILHSQTEGPKISVNFSFQVWCHLKFPLSPKNHFPVIHDTKPTKCSNFALNIYITVRHWMFLNVSVGEGRSSENQTKVLRHKVKLITFVNSWHGVKGQVVKMETFLCRIVV